ncbi:MAG: sulfotransferase [Candidatus Heimdallarchaeota archaeon]|nr:sulfotransferase [Candidatus Heimdallarchaeota archaeon]
MKKHWIVKEEPLAGSSISNIIRLLWQNKFRIHPKYWLRFIYAITLSALCTPLRWIERIRFNRKIKKTKINQDPLFIIGHYRTGTTYLITTLAHDKSKGYVSNIEGYAPHFFLAFPKFTKWLLDMSLPEQRPMDNVIMGSDEPTEEEYSIGAYDKYGFYNGFIFPRNFDQYSKYNSFDECSPQDVKNWKKRYYFFVQKMTLKYNGNMLFLKNPANTYRIKYILEMFPNAKFVHIYRNPYKMYASTLKFFREVFEIYALQTWDDEEMQQGILRNYREMYEKLAEERHLIPEDRIIDIQYEEFLKEPMKHIERIYKELDIDGFEEYKEDFQKYIDSQSDYQPNKHVMSDDIIRRVNKHWDFIRAQHGYPRLEPKEMKKEKEEKIKQEILVKAR